MKIINPNKQEEMDWKGIDSWYKIKPSEVCNLSPWRRKVGQKIFEKQTIEVFPNLMEQHLESTEEKYLPTKNN